MLTKPKVDTKCIEGQNRGNTWYYKLKPICLPICLPICVPFSSLKHLSRNEKWANKVSSSKMQRNSVYACANGIFSLGDQEIHFLSLKMEV